MRPETYLLAVAVGAGMLGLWCDSKLERIRPGSFQAAVLHLAVAFLAAALAAPALQRVLALGVSPGFALLFVVLPVLVYLFAAHIWLIRVLQGLMLGARR